MFDVNLVSDSLQGLVGYRQPANPKYQIVDTENQQSESGLYITDNPYAKIEYLRDNHDYSRVSNVDFNKFLKNLKRTSITSVCSQIFDKPDFLDRDLIYTKNINKVANNEFQLPSGFVGYRVSINSKKNVAFRLNRAIFEINNSGELQFLVFNSNIDIPIYSEKITYANNYSTHDINFTCNDLGYYKGTFYIGFIANSEITYRRNFEDASIQNIITYLDIKQVKVNHNDETMFDQNEVQYLEHYCGFNLDITVVDDFTDLIINNKSLFSRAIYLNSIIACLNVYAASLRSNGNERDSKELYSLIMLEIEGTRPDDNVVHIRGLRPEMLYEISQIREQLLQLKNGFMTIGYNVDTQD